jgi:predicted RNA-binding Zn ribbon-like protein
VIASGSDDERLMLALLNSTPIVDGEQRDELAVPEDAQVWLASHGQPDTTDEVKALLRLRPVLQNVVRGAMSPSALSPFLTKVAYAPRAADDGIEWDLKLPDGREAAARAVLAWGALHSLSPGRLRPCANPECRRFLIDRSKPNSARWCSMAVCGNRMKARRHYEKSRGA